MAHPSDWTRVLAVHKFYLKVLIFHPVLMSDMFQVSGVPTVGAISELSFRPVVSDSRLVTSHVLVNFCIDHGAKSARFQKFTLEFRIFAQKKLMQMRKTNRDVIQSLETAEIKNGFDIELRVLRWVPPRLLTS